MWLYFVTGLLLLPLLRTAIVNSLGRESNSDNTLIAIVLASISILSLLFAHSLRLVPNAVPVLLAAAAQLGLLGVEVTASSAALVGLLICIVIAMRSIPVSLSYFESGVIAQGVLFFSWDCYVKVSNAMQCNALSSQSGITLTATYNVSPFLSF
jgi:hypothetical protein